MIYFSSFYPAKSAV